MHEKGFAEYLTPMLGAGSVQSYLACCRRVEETLGINLDALVLTETLLANIRNQLEQKPDTFAAKSIANCMSALRSYAAFVERSRHDSGLSAPKAVQLPVLKNASLAPAVSPARSRPEFDLVVSR